MRTKTNEYRVRGVCVLWLVVALSGCATVTTYSDRRHPTETAPGDKFAVILREYEECKADDCHSMPVAYVEQGFAACLANAALREAPQLTAITGTEFKRIAFGAKDVEWTPRTPADLMRLLQDAEIRRRIDALRLRYIVMLSVVTSETALEQRVSRGYYGTWGVGSESKRTSKLSATIVDVKEARESGLLIAGSSGKIGSFWPVVVLIPLPPVPLVSTTESLACDSLGRIVAQFLSQRDNKDEFHRLRQSISFPKSLLHPSIADKVLLALGRGELEEAVFAAFKAVEISVREAGKFAATDVGAPLMRKAFDKNTGPLTDRTQPEAEREALANLFAGAIGSYRNPYSHRTTTITDPLKAQEVVMLASHLLGIVEARRKTIAT